MELIDKMFQTQEKFGIDKKNHSKIVNHYNNNEKIVILMTFLIIFLGFLLRAWRIIREGMPIAFDGYYFQMIAKKIFFEKYYDFAEITRDPPGLFFILVIAEHLLGLGGKPIMWSIFIFPQIICSMQLIIFFLLARRLTHSRINALLYTLFMTILGLIVYRNQNIAPETIVLGLVPFTVFYIYRYFETKKSSFLVVGIAISIPIIFIHHLSTFIMLINWHVLFLYEMLFERIKFKKRNLKEYLVNLAILMAVDLLVFIVWLFVLKGFPQSFIAETLRTYFKNFKPVTTNFLTIIGAVFLDGIVFTFLWQNINKLKIKITVILIVIISCLLLFILLLFYGGSSPDTNFISAFLMGTPIIIIPPLAATGFVMLEKIELLETRVTKGWLFGLVGVTTLVALIPRLSDILARLALYLIPAGVILATYGIYSIIKKIRKGPIKTIMLLSLIGSMAITMTFAYPKPENNWGQQEIFFKAEFSTIDFLSNYLYTPNNTVWEKNCPILIDADLRACLLIEGYGGFDATFGQSGSSWLQKIITIQEQQNRSLFVQTISPADINANLDIIFITNIMYTEGFITNWADYGSSKDNWIVKLPDISKDLSINPYLTKIYCNDIVYLLLIT